MRLLYGDTYIDQGTVTVNLSGTAGTVTSAITFADGGFDALLAEGFSLETDPGCTVYRLFSASTSGAGLTISITHAGTGGASVSVRWWAIGVKGRKAGVVR